MSPSGLLVLCSQVVTALIEGAKGLAPVFPALFVEIPRYWPQLAIRPGAWTVDTAAATSYSIELRVS